MAREPDAHINTSGSDSLTVDLSNDGGATFSRLVRYNQSGTVAAGFSNQVLNIVSTSATAVLRFRARGDYGVTDIGLDNIVLESATGCLTPAVLTATTTTTTASLSWLPGGTGTYTVLYGPTGRALWATSFLSGAWRSQEYVIFQSDGNLVTYGGGRALWWSGTSGSGARFELQNDGNLVIYTAANRAVWSSGTSGRT